MESLELLTKEVILLLHKDNLLRPLIKAQLSKRVLSQVTIDKKIAAKLKAQFLKKIGFSDDKDDSYDGWLAKNFLTREDIQELILRDIRLKKYAIQNFEHQVEARFLERKSQLDILVYSLIRVKDFFKAKEIYLRLSEQEADFGDLATLFSEGLEKKTRGVIGPAPLESAHPQLVELLKSSQPGVIQSPLKINDSYMVVRVESYEPAKLDDFMREKMATELYNQWLEKEVEETNKNLLNNNIFNELNREKS